MRLPLYCPISMHPYNHLLYPQLPRSSGHLEFEFVAIRIGSRQSNVIFLDDGVEPPKRSSQSLDGSPSAPFC